MATHSTVLAWKIPWAEEPGELHTMELQKVRRDLATKTTITNKYLEIMFFSRFEELEVSSFCSSPVTQ